MSWAQREAAKIAREDIIHAAERADFEQREAAARELRRENHRRAQAASNAKCLARFSPEMIKAHNITSAS